MSAWREALDAQRLSDRVEAYQRASPEAVAAREAEYDRIAPRWREFRDAPSFGIVRQRVLFVERRPYDGAWAWFGHLGYESRFSMDGAVALMKRIREAGILDASIVPSLLTHGPNTTDEQIATGVILV